MTHTITKALFFQSLKMLCLLVIHCIVNDFDFFYSFGYLKLQVFVVLKEVDSVHPSLEDTEQDRCFICQQRCLEWEDLITQNILVHENHATLLLVAQKHDFRRQTEILCRFFAHISESPGQLRETHLQNLA